MISILLQIIDSTQYVLRLVGIAISTLGSLTVIYPDIEQTKVKRLIKLVSPKIQTIEDAREDYYSSGSVTNKDHIRVIEEIFEARYVEGDKEGPPERIRATTGGPRLEYPDGTKKSSAFNRSESADIELQLLFSEGLRRCCRQSGMQYIAIGFVALFLGTI